jgi:hypothetical protein
MPHWYFIVSFCIGVAAYRFLGAALLVPLSLAIAAAATMTRSNSIASSNWLTSVAEILMIVTIVQAGYLTGLLIHLALISRKAPGERGGRRRDT